MAFAPRILIVASHPVPYIQPLFRAMVAQNWSFQVAYCSLEGVEPYRDRDFNTEIAWDVPLLSGYPWVALPNRSPWPGLGRFWGLCNPGLWHWIREVDVVIVYTGYVYASFWIALLAARWHGKGFIFSTDTSRFASRSGEQWKRGIKAWLLPRLYRLADAVLVSTAFGQAVITALGVPRDRVIVTPFVTDNDWWLAQSDRCDRAAWRQTWGIPLDASVVVFCAKLQPWKRPQDLLAAFQQANVPNSYLLYVGDGALRQELTAQTQGWQERIRFLGFQNQSQLPGIYTAADLLCLCSEYEPFGVVVNEAMLCGCGVVVSDRVGARELVTPGKTGEVYPYGDIAALTQILRALLSNPAQLHQMGMAARSRMQTWSPRENLAAQQDAIAIALNARAS